MNRIRDRLRSATDVDMVKKVAAEEREIVQRFADNHESRGLAVILSNLKSYTLKKLSE